MASSAPEEFIQRLLERAVLSNAADVHLEVFEKNFRVRLRTPAGLQEFPAPDISTYGAIVRRLKLMGNLDIAQTRIPQDGKFEANVGGGIVEFRLATLPSFYGESFVLRVLDRGRIPLELESLGLDPDSLCAFKQALALPYGLVCVVGPTGSGKTTSLYAGLRYLSGKSLKIVSVEDPVEYSLEGVSQVAVKGALDYPMALRAFLRHDPDLIFVGEIRDSDSARLAVQAALTGHLVLTSLHTDSTQQAIGRLIDLGIAPQLLGASVKFVMAQKLITQDGLSRTLKASTLMVDSSIAEQIASGNFTERTSLCS